jgi:RNA polymerase sigma-70 factor (ECF subfamily)
MVSAPTVVETEDPDLRDLLGRARAGDNEAFCALCRVHESGLLRQAAALCGNATLAEDLAQDTLVEAWKSLRRYDGRCRFFTWLCAILLNRYRNTLRQRRPLAFSTFSQPEQDQFANQLEQLADGAAWPDQAAQIHEQAAVVRRSIQALPPKQEQVVYLRFYVDESLEGIAAALGCSVGTVKSRLFHALDKLRGMKELSGQHAPATIKMKSL